jgi:maltooligosyltrehalose trehalohydrolase
VGNRGLGDRLSTLTSPDRLRMSAALVLLSPYLPLLFMGEEYGETNPFRYFIEHSDPDLVEAVRQGRMKEFPEIARVGAEADPQSEETFARSRLDWSRRDTRAGAQLLALYRDLLALRREEPALRPGASEVHAQGTAEWQTVLRVMPLRHDIYDHTRSRRALLCVFNLSDHPSEIPIRADAAGAWRLRLSTDAGGYGGSGQLTEVIPDIVQPITTDAPKRLIDPDPAHDATRSILLAPWSAAVYVRAFLDDDSRDRAS